MKYDLAQGRPVVLVSHGFQTNYERGFTNGLADAGVQVTLVSSDRTDYAGLRSGVRTVNLRGSQEERRPKWAKALNQIRYHLSLLIFAIRNRGAILHIMGLIDPPFLLGVVEGLWFRTFCWRYVLTVHDLLPHDRHSSANRLLFGFSFRLAHRLVAHTERVKEDLVNQFGVRPERVVVMEHGIEPVEESLPELMGQPGAEAPWRLLCFGVIKRYKGVDVLLDALEKTNVDFTLTIAGFCPDAYLERELKARIAAHPFASRIVMRSEFIPESEMVLLFAGADALVMPYRYIDQSGVLFQALRFGLPIVASRVGSLESYISHEVGETCRPEDVQDLVRALERLHARRGQMRRQRIAEIGRGFEWPKTVMALAQAYC